MFIGNSSIGGSSCRNPSENFFESPHSVVLTVYCWPTLLCGFSWLQVLLLVTVPLLPNLIYLLLFACVVLVLLALSFCAQDVQVSVLLSVGMSFFFPLSIKVLHC